VKPQTQEDRGENDACRGCYKEKKPPRKRNQREKPYDWEGTGTNHQTVKGPGRGIRE